MKMRVLVVHHYSLYREGITALLGKDSIMDVKEATDDWLDLVRIAKDFRPHVIIMSLGIPAKIRSLIFSSLEEDIMGIRILLLAPPGKEDDIIQALKDGAHGYVPLTASQDEFLKAVKEIAKKEYWMQRSLSKKLVEYLRQGPPIDAAIKKHASAEGGHPLTRRDRDVALLLSEGLSEKEIARRLKISSATVHTHLRRVFAFFGVTTRSKAIARLRQPE